MLQMPTIKFVLGPSADNVYPRRTLFTLHVEAMKRQNNVIAGLPERLRGKT